MKLSSPEFHPDGKIPETYSEEGANISPEIDVKGIPPHTRSLVVIAEDPDPPTGPWIHWLVYDIPPLGRIRRGAHPGTEGLNSLNRIGYLGPWPPEQKHRYIFTVYALDVMLNLEKGQTADEVRRLMAGHVIESSSIEGRYPA